MKNLLSFFLLCFYLTSTAQTWTPYNVGSSSIVVRMSFPTQDTGYIGLDNGTIRKTVNGALNWSSCTVPSIYFSTIEFTSGTKGFGYGLQGIKMTTDGAQTWNYVMVDSTHYGYDICAATSSVVYASMSTAVGDSLILYKSVNGGNSWTQMPSQFLPMMTGDMYFSNADTGFIVGGDWIFRTMDGGATWSTVFTEPNGDPLTYISSYDGINVYAVTQGLQFIASNNGGNTWSPIGPTSPNPVYGIGFTAGLNGFVCGGNGLSSGFVDYTSNGGLT